MWPQYWCLHHTATHIFVITITVADKSTKCQTKRRSCNLYTILTSSLTKKVIRTITFANTGCSDQYAILQLHLTQHVPNGILNNWNDRLTRQCTCLPSGVNFSTNLAALRGTQPLKTAAPASVLGYIMALARVKAPARVHPVNMRT